MQKPDPSAILTRRCPKVRVTVPAWPVPGCKGAKIKPLKAPRKPVPLIVLILTATSGWVQPGSRASEPSRMGSDFVILNKAGQKPEFRTRYLMAGYSRNFPAGNASNRFGAGIPHPGLGYRYFINNHWLAGVGAGFRFLTEKNSDEDLILASITHEISYISRVYYPLYTTAGWKIIWMTPVRKGMLPLQRHPDYSPEPGAAIAAGLLYKLSPECFLELRLERWRGTKTMKLHAAEISISLGHSL